MAPKGAKGEKARAKAKQGPRQHPKTFKKEAFKHLSLPANYQLQFGAVLWPPLEIPG